MPKRISPRSRSPRAEKEPPNIQLAEDSPEFERRWFKLDRDAVISQLTILRRTMAKGARQMEAIAREGTFDTPLSEAILYQSKMMREHLRELRKLVGKVASATGYPSVEEP
jgi:hypothetical protein